MAASHPRFGFVCPGLKTGEQRTRLQHRHVDDNTVREMVRKEQQCCAFLNFELSEIDEGVRLAITAPERAREVADALFEQFVPAGLSATTGCAAT